MQRMGELKSIATVEEMIQYRIGRCHPLKGDRNGQYALDLAHPFRLIIKKDGITNSIQLVKIIEIEDYH